jgi:hypothetical protein
VEERDAGSENAMKGHFNNHRLGVMGAGLMAVAAMALAPGAALAASDKSKGSNPPCFFINQWQGWKSPSPDVIYLGVNIHDVYRVELSGGSPELQWPDVHLISRTVGSDSICSAIDLQLEVADDTTRFREPLIARKLTKLTPDEIAAIPRQFRPN